jgi:hypothetical protein
MTLKRGGPLSQQGLEPVSQLANGAKEERYVLLVVTSRNRSDQRLDVVEFRSNKAAQRALDHVKQYDQFDAVVVDDSC